MKKLILVLLFVVIYLFVKSQDVKITIVDSLSGKPISYTSVFFIDEKSGTYTNENGIFYTDKSSHTIQISRIGYNSKTIKFPIKDDIIKLRPQIYLLDEIIVMPNKKEYDIIGYSKFKSNFTYSGLSGDELAVYIFNSFNCEKRMKEIMINFDTRKIVKDDLKIDFVSVFRINFYSKNENLSEPDSLIIVKDLVFTSKVIKNKTKIDISNYNLKLPKNGIFISIEWIGIESENTKELITNYKDRTEPFISTTFDKTSTFVYERNKFKDKKWKLLDKNNKYSILLKKDNFYTPCVGISLYK